MRTLKPIRTRIDWIRRLTARQWLAMTTGMAIALVGLAGLGLGQPGWAVASVLSMQLVLIALLLLATHRLSSRLASAIDGVLKAVGRRGSESLPVKARNRGKARAAAPLSAMGARRFHVKTNRGKYPELETQLVRDRSIDGRNILAHAATGGELDFDGVCVLLECFRSASKRGKVRTIAKRFDEKALLSLARVLYRQEALPQDLLNAITLFELVKVVFGRKALAPCDREWAVNALLQERRPEEALDWMDTLGVTEESSPNHHLFMANATNPHVQPVSSGEQVWLQHFNAGLVRHGLEPIVLGEEAGSCFGRLRASPGDMVEDGPLISVVMPVYAAGPDIDIAVGSILSQSWRNLEVIIVVDGGPAEYLDAWQRDSKDDRVRVIRCAKNRGTYTARNIGLDAARGVFVTCHDSDDWSHPRKLEIQARHLIANPGCVANMSRLLRVTDELEIKHRSPSSLLVQPALISLMFRREQVMTRIGYWDSVRKMGDAEFVRRIELAFGQEVPAVCDTALTLALHDPRSLSGSDMYRGYMHPERQMYRARYRAWHKQIEAGKATVWMPKDPRHRPFVAPAAFLPVPPAEQGVFDVVFVSELGFTGGNAHSLIHEMSICVDAGLKVGLIHAKNLLFTHLSTREPLQGLTDLIASGAVTELAVTSKARARLVIVRWPACFQYRTSLECGIEAERAVIVANHPPYEKHQDRHSYEIGLVSENVRTCFGVAPQWAPQSDTIRRMLVRQLPHGSLLDIDWVGVLAEEPRAIRKRRDAPTGRPVIGRHSRDHHLKWPEKRETLLKVYPADGSVGVKVLGGIDSIVANGVVTSGDVEHWEVHPFGSLQPMQFLQTVDFFVYYHHKDWVEAFGRVIMEAMFAGAVVVLPPSFRRVFGDAALYAEPDGVQALVREYSADRSLFLAQSERGMAYALGNCTPSAYRRRLRKLGLEMKEAEAQPGAA